MHACVVQRGHRVFEGSSEDAPVRDAVFFGAACLDAEFIDAEFIDAEFIDAGFPADLRLRGVLMRSPQPSPRRDESSIG